MTKLSDGSEASVSEDLGDFFALSIRRNRHGNRRCKNEITDFHGHVSVAYYSLFGYLGLNLRLKSKFRPKIIINCDANFICYVDFNHLHTFSGGSENQFAINVANALFAFFNTFYLFIRVRQVTTMRSTFRASNLVLADLYSFKANGQHLHYWKWLVICLSKKMYIAAY
ncbi:MAG: hypothetical protein R2809_05365 [Flavobacteriales bacterium]